MFKGNPVGVEEYTLFGLLILLLNWLGPLLLCWLGPLLKRRGHRSLGMVLMVIGGIGLALFVVALLR